MKLLYSLTDEDANYAAESIGHSKKLTKKQLDIVRKNIENGMDALGWISILEAAVQDAIGKKKKLK